MPTVNRVSLCEEFDVFRERFHDLCEQGRVSPEYEALFSGLLMPLMLTVFMEKTKRKGSWNSGLPISQTPPNETALGKIGAKGKGQDPKVHNNASVREVNETLVSVVTERSGCGRDMAGWPTQATRDAR